VSLDALPSERSGGSIVDRVVREVGQAARELVTGPLRQSGLYAVVRERQHRHGDDLDPAVTALDPDHPSTWWQGDASDGAVVALGVSGEREPVLASFDANDAGLLIAGVTARDVASAIDSVVTGIAMTYAPTEVQLIATAFGTRSERPTAGIAEPFAGYGEAGLPHARFVATDA